MYCMLIQNTKSSAQEKIDHPCRSDCMVTWHQREAAALWLFVPGRDGLPVQNDDGLIPKRKEAEVGNSEDLFRSRCQRAKKRTKLHQMAKDLWRCARYGTLRFPAAAAEDRTQDLRIMRPTRLPTAPPRHAYREAKTVYNGNSANR